MAFAAAGKLLLFRVETTDEHVSPLTEGDRVKYPRLCRIRNLLGPDWPRPLAEIKDFNWAVKGAVAPPDGSYFVVDGVGGPRGERRIAKVFAADGRELYSIPTRMPTRGCVMLAVDPTGTFVAVGDDERPRGLLLEMPGCTATPLQEYFPGCLSPKAEHFAMYRQGPISDQGVVLFRSGVKDPLVRLVVNSRGVTLPVQFSPDGRLLAWGNIDGSVAVCHLEEIRGRLAELDLGW